MHKYKRCSRPRRPKSCKSPGVNSGERLVTAVQSFSECIPYNLATLAIKINLIKFYKWINQSNVGMWQMDPFRR